MLFSRRKATAIVLATIGVVAFGTGLTSAAFAADTTPPGNVTGLTATPLSSTSIQLNWTNPADADLVGVRVCRNLGATAPTWPCGGVNVGKASHTFTDTFQIFPSTQYTYSVFAFDTSLNVNATGAHASATTPATVNPPPANVTGLTATPLAGPSVKLDWTNPADADFAGVRICRAFGSVAPTLPCGGVNVLKPTNTFTDSNALIPNTQYTYAVFAFDTGANAASGASATVTTAASVNPPPANVTGLTATPTATTVKLDWTNPADADFAGVRICRAFGSVAPTLPCAGINLAKPTNTYTDSASLIPNTQYTYAVFAFDTGASAASGASVTVTTLTVPPSPPGNVTGLTATALNGTSIKLDWTNPPDANFAGVRICRTFGTVAPTLPCAGVNLLSPTNTYTDSVNLIPGTEYTYSVFAISTSGDAASGAHATATTTEI